MSGELHSPRVGGDRGGRHCSTERILLMLPQILLAVRIGITVGDFFYVWYFYGCVCAFLSFGLWFHVPGFVFLFFEP